MFNPFDYLETWWHNTYKDIKPLFFGDKEETAPEENLTKLPPELFQHLTKLVESLPNPPNQQEDFQTVLEAALEKWREYPATSSNSLVVLTNPVESVFSLFTEGLNQLPEKLHISCKWLPWNERPDDFRNIPEKLRSQLGRATLVMKEGHEEIVVIPNLSWCFLRGVEGLDGIDYLRDIVLKDRSRFWLIGAQQVSWQYLDYVDKIEAYFDQTFSLPTLEEEDLQAWLAPIITEAKIGFSDKLAKEERETAQQKYFKKLTVRSRGISSVAKQLFLDSLSYEVNNSESQEESATIKVENPYLPDLPSLSHNQHYLLFSLLLHGVITLPHLAYSLGDDEDIVQNLIQVLYRSGVVNKEGTLLQVNPIYYPELRDDLDGNNFLI